MDVKYTAEAVSTGSGRDGAIRSSDGRLDHPVRMPPALGGDGAGTNPEQLFAAAYSACFHGALRLVAGNEKVALPDGTTVTARVDLGTDGGGFGIGATIVVAVPGLDQAQADDLVRKAHEVCPYSKATRGNIDVALEARV